jgi:hypothetical protein
MQVAILLSYRTGSLANVWDSLAGMPDGNGASMEVREFLKRQAAKGGKTAAKRMTAAQRKARARKAAAASAKVRSAKAKARKKEGK